MPFSAMLNGIHAFARFCLRENAFDPPEPFGLSSRAAAYRRRD